MKLLGISNYAATGIRWVIKIRRDSTGKSGGNRREDLEDSKTIHIFARVFIKKLKYKRDNIKQVQ